jgi:osmotically-inducible protein OsmY
MRSAMKRDLLRLAFLAPVLALAGCGFFRDVKETGHEVKKVGEDVEKALNKMEQPAKGKSEKQPPPAPPEHEGALLDNKVTALRVQEALRKAGPEFQHVEVSGTVNGVTMTGTVQRSADRVRAEEIAKSVHRAMKLKNELRVEK